MYDSGHGGNWAAFSENDDILDFSASVSPLGVPWGVRRAIRASARHADRYPDPLCRRLCQAVCQAEQLARFGLSEENVLCGAGATDLIYRAALAVSPRRAVVPVPSFSEYESALQAARCPDIQLIPFGQDFRPDKILLRHITRKTDLLFLCQPNNPTGLTIPRSLLKDTLKHCRSMGCTLVLDESFLPFLDKPKDYTAKDLLSQYPNLVILRSFTKLHNCAGVRVGYALCGDAALLEKMARSGPPWAVSLTAEEVGLAALRNHSRERQMRRLLKRERPRLLDALGKLGLQVVHGEANFLLFQSPVLLDDSLRKQNIVLRNCGNFQTLNNLWYRTAIRTETENDLLLSALGKILKK